MPEISVIVPVYNVEPYIHRCIDSILNQTFTDFELILVDDGSPDNCGKICDGYSKKDNRIRVIHQENGGLSAARNAGIDWAFQNSNSEWLTFIDSDDWVHPRYLELLKKAADDTGIPITLVSYAKTGGESIIFTEENIAVETVNTRDLYSEHYTQFITAWGKLYKKDDFKSLRFPKGKLHEDEFTVWRVLFRYPNLALINLPLYAYFINKDGITNSKWNIQRSDGLEAHKLRLKEIEGNSDYFAFREKTVKLIAYTMAGYIDILDKEDCSENKALIKRYRKELKRFLREHKRILPFKGYGWPYEKAYPKLSYFLIMFSEIFGRLKAKYLKN